jgi:hypothetical protein
LDERRSFCRPALLPLLRTMYFTRMKKVLQITRCRPSSLAN